MLKKILFILFSIIVLFVAFIYFFVNNEDRNFKVKNNLITHQVIAEHLKNEKFVLMVLSTSCEGCNSGINVIKKDIEYFKSNNIDYIIVFDELHNSDTDKEIEEFRVRNKFSEKAYLIDASKYADNIKFIDSRKRLKDFLNHFIPNIDDIILGYPQYFYFKNGVYKGNSFYELQAHAKKYF